MRLNVVPDQLHGRIESRVDNAIISTAAWQYLDEDGRIIGAVVRADLENGKKTFLQADYEAQRKQYKLKGDNVKRSLYNRPAIAKCDIAIWVEGEKTADALQEIVDPDKYAVFTNAGGCTVAHVANLSPLKGKKIIIWHDNDTPGKHAAIRLSTKLGDQVAGWVKINPEWKPKWDAYDVIQEYGADYTLACLKDLEGAQTSKLESPNIVPEKTLPFKILGRTVEDDAMIYCFQDATIRAVSSRGFDQGMMVKIYTDMSFWFNFCGTSPKTNKPDPSKGWEKIWREVKKIGLFRPEATRFGGIYKEESGYVASLGDRLFVNGEIKDLCDHMSEAIYVEDTRADIDIHSGDISQDEANDLTSYFKHIRTKIEAQSELMMGWAVASYLAPILPRRPHMWLFAPANTGKSYISERLRRICQPFAVNMDSSSTTYAGLKQFVQGRGCALFWDESEAQQESAKDKWDRVMEVVRVSFDARDGKIVQGSKEQVAKFFVPRMMFCFSSVKMADFEETLSTRIIPVQLNKSDNKRDMIDYFKRSKELERKINWDTLPSKIFHRMYNEADRYFDLEQRLTDMYVEQGIDERRAHALSVCQAGFLNIKIPSGKNVTDATLNKLLWKNPNLLMPDVTTEASHLLAILTNALVGCRDVEGRFQNINIMDMVKAIKSSNFDIDGVPVRAAEREFKAHGLIYIRNEDRLFVWEKSPRLKRIIGKYDGISSVAPTLDGYRRERFNNITGFSFILNT